MAARKVKAPKSAATAFTKKHVGMTPQQIMNITSRPQKAERKLGGKAPGKGK